MPDKQRFRVLRLGHSKDTNLLVKNSNLEIVIINAEGVPEFGADGEMKNEHEGALSLSHRKNEVCLYLIAVGRRNTTELLRLPQKTSPQEPFAADKPCR